MSQIYIDTEITDIGLIIYDTSYISTEKSSFNFHLTLNEAETYIARTIN